MKRIAYTLLIAILITPLTLFAGTYGKLSGKVVDDEGKPVAGATVKIKGTAKGAKTKADGTFSVIGVPVGKFEVDVTMVGKANAVENVAISVDETTQINIVLHESSITTKPITISGSKLVNVTELDRGSKMTGEQMKNIGSRDDLGSQIALNAGVMVQGGELYIRGSRPQETQIRIDGLDVSNQYTGSMGASGSTYYPTTSTLATEEVQVMTGAFSAEYGNALGGIVNSVVKTGRTDHYEGYLSWKTDVPSLWGRQNKGSHLVQDADQLIIKNYGKGLKLMSNDENTYDFGVGGPLQILDNATFFISGKYLTEKYRNNGYEMYDPLGNNLGQIEGNNTWEKNITGRIKLPINNKISITVGGQFGLSTFQQSSQYWYYSRDMGMIPQTNAQMQTTYVSNGIEERTAKQNGINQFVNNGMIRLNHQIDDNNMYELTISNTYTATENARRKNNNDPSFFGGFDLYTPQDNYAIGADGASLVAGTKDFVIDQYTYWTTNGTSKDYKDANGKWHGYNSNLLISGINPLTGYIEGDADATSTTNPWGRQAAFYSHGNSSGFEYALSDYYQVDGNYMSNIETKDVKHMFKTGFEVRFFELNRHENQTPWVQNGFYDVYTDKWGGNLYTENPAVYSKTSKPYKPITGAFYVQDQIIYKGIIFSPGLRFDFTDPKADYRIASQEFIPIVSDTGLKSSTVKLQVSPRMSVKYPISERSDISISYGSYYQMPNLQYMYNSNNISVLRGSSILGNPNMKAQKTNSYEVAYESEISDLFAVDLTAYYKDVYNQTGLEYVPAVPDPFYRYVTAEYGNNKGLEFTLRKRLTDHYDFNINYTLAKVSGTSASPEGNYQPPTDPYTGYPVLPLTEYALGNDRRHRLNMDLDINWGNDEGPTIQDVHVLENTNLNFTGFYQTGNPYTRTDKKGNPIGAYNSLREPDYWRVDMRLRREFQLKDYFGESVGKSSIQFYIDVTNLFNLTDYVSVYPITGDPDNDGTTFDRKVGDFSSNPWFKDADPTRSETFQADQYDRAGCRLYNAASDFDHNGIVTQAEKYQAWKNYLSLPISRKSNYQPPREVYIGFTVQF